MDKSIISLKNSLIVLLLLFGSNLKGQIIDADTTQVNVVPSNAEELHSPKKAALYSTILPGLGQAYNKKYWKIPIIYAGFGAIGYFMVWNNNNYKISKIAYIDLTDGDPLVGSHLDLKYADQYDLTDQTSYNNFKTSLSKQQDYYRRNRDLLFISMFAFYGLNIIDASVDAHFFDFDISEDLSFNWQPAMNSMDKQLSYGLNCTFNF